MRELFAALDPVDFPHLPGAADEIVGMTDEQSFEQGLALIVEGLRTRIAAPGRKSRVKKPTRGVKNA